MTSGKILLILMVLMTVNLARASPIRSESYPNIIFGPPIFGFDNLEENTRAETLPVVYALFLKTPESLGSPDNLNIAKRSVQEPELEDLATAAGTNALRPLFVYRQQVAYRQRVREAIRQRNRF